MSLAERVARRFLAEAIADPKEFLEKFRTRVVELCRHVDFAKADIPKLRAFLEENAKADADMEGGPTRYDKTKELGVELNKASSERYQVGAEIKNGYWFMNGRNEGRRLFWSILQQYALPPQLQKSIEAANKFWSKTRTVTRTKAKYGFGEDLELEVLYLKTCAELQKQLANAEAAIVKGTLHADPVQAAKTKFPAGAFTVVNTGGFDDATMQKSIEVVTKADHAMTNAGLGKVCYGDVLISKNIRNSKSIMAFYLPSSDEFFARADIPADYDHVRYVCHELTHRLQHKFLASKKASIIALYAMIHNASSFAIRAEDFPKKGEEVMWNGKKFYVTGVETRHKIVRVALSPQDSSYYRLPLEVFNKMKGVPPPPEAAMKFVTGYAQKGGPDENFAEMVSFYVLGKLPAEQVKSLEEILFG